MARGRRPAGRSEYPGLRAFPSQRTVEASVTSLRWPKNPRLLWPLKAVTRDAESDQQRTALGEGTPLLMAQGGPHRCGAPSPTASALAGCGAAQSRAQAVVATPGWVLRGEGGQAGLGCRKVPCLDLGHGYACVDGREKPSSCTGETCARSRSVVLGEKCREVTRAQLGCAGRCGWQGHGRGAGGRATDAGRAGGRAAGRESTCFWKRARCNWSRVGAWGSVWDRDTLIMGHA